MEKENLIATLGTDKYEEICKWAKQTAPSTGKSSDISTGENIQEIISNFAELIWDQPENVEEKLKLTFEIYVEAPSYSFIFQIALQYSDFSEKEKDIFWYQCIGYLSGDNSGLSSPVEYSIWCDFFEDPEWVHDVWNRLFKENRNHLFIERILESSGPVPYLLKENLYLELISNSLWHVYIYRSLLRSSFDYFGKIDKWKALNVLNQLQLSDPEHLGLLLNKLQE